jgi:hypothetical protein
LLQGIVALLEEEVADIRIGFEEARRTSIESPGRMQSRYDTMGVEAAWVADGLAKNLKSKIESLARLRQLRLPPAPLKGCVGAVVGVGTPEGSESIYFILPGGGGQTVQPSEKGAPVVIVTPGSPAGKALIGKEIGDEVIVGADSDLKSISWIL